LKNKGDLGFFILWGFIGIYGVLADLWSKNGQKFWSKENKRIDL